MIRLFIQSRSYAIDYATKKILVTQVENATRVELEHWRLIAKKPFPKEASAIANGFDDNEIYLRYEFHADRQDEHGRKIKIVLIFRCETLNDANKVHSYFAEHSNDIEEGLKKIVLEPHNKNDGSFYVDFDLLHTQFPYFCDGKFPQGSSNENKIKLCYFDPNTQKITLKKKRITTCKIIVIATVVIVIALGALAIYKMATRQNSPRPPSQALRLGSKKNQRNWSR